MPAYQLTAANIKRQFSLELGFCLMFDTYVVFQGVNYSVVNLRSPKSQMKHVLQKTSLTPHVYMLNSFLLGLFT